MRLVHLSKAAFSVVILLLSGFAFSQTTNGNGTAWLTGGNWAGGSAPGAYAAGAPNTLSFTNQTININHPMIVGSYGTTTNMVFANSNFAGEFNVAANTNFIVYGSMNFVNKAMNLVIGSNATMIVLGDFDLGNQIDIATTGRLVVSGDFSKSGAANQGTFSGSGSVYASTYSGSADGFIPGNVATGSDQQQVIDDLIDDNFQDIWDFVNGGGSTPLPVELVTFQSQTASQGIVLTWHTASELNNDYFDIERSENTKDFYSIGRVQGHGTTSEPKTYTFSDKQPIAAISYYRLKQVDFDGAFEYSRIIVGETDKLAGITEMKAYPNPARDLITLKSTVPVEFARLQLINIAGQVVADLTPVTFGFGLQTQVNLPKVEKGMYYLTYQTAQGEKGVQKLMVD